MTSSSWATATSGDWNTGTLWTGGVPNSATADVTIDVTAMPPAAYTVTIGAGESFTVDSLTINDTEASAQGANSNPQTSADLELDGTLTFAPGSAGIFGNHTAAGGSLQTTIYTVAGANAEIVNAGTIDGFIQVQGGNLLLTGTNGVYITNELQALGGTATIDTSSIAEITGNTQFDGIFEAVGPGSVVNLGGSLEGLVVNIGTIEGPPLNPGGWTELMLNGPNTEINQWNGSAYVSIETTLTEIAGAGTVDVLTGRDYTTTNVLTVDAGVGGIGPGMLNLQAGTVTTGGLVINGGIVQGSATIVGGVVNDGTLIALGGTMDLTGGLTGTGGVEFDFDLKEGTLDASGATLVVNAVSAGQTFTMNGDDTLVLATPSAFAGTIAAKVGDQIILDGLTATGAALNNGTLLVSNGSVVVASLALVGNYSGDSFITNGSIVTFGTAVAPTIRGTSAGQAVTDQATITPFASVVIADANVGQTETVTVTLSAPANGTLTNLGGGTYNATTGVYTATGSAGAVTAALNALVFVPTAHEVASGQTVETTFTINDVDTATKTATDATTTVIATAGATALVIGGALAGQTTSNQASIAPFSGVTIADANPGQTETVTVTLSAVANGILTNLGGGTYNASTGVYTATGSAAAVTADLNALVFTPTAHGAVPGQAVTTTFTIGDVDNAAQTATNNTTTVIATAGTVPPVISGSVPGQTSSDQTAISPFAGVTIGDANPGQTETVTVALSAAANGTLSDLGGGSYDATTGIYTDTGSTAAVTGDLDGLVFTPTAGQVTAGQSVTTGFTISDTDTAGASATDSTTSVVATALPTQFAMTDTTTGVASTIVGTPYSGPVAGLQWEFITTTTDSLAITATAPNVFIHGGSGSNAIDVSHVNGNNVLDGGDGSNFLVGGTGEDTFFVDDRSPASPIWDTVANFHSGDAATIWGVTPNDFTLSWVNGQGANGYTGLTLHVTGAGVPTASLTLTGFTTADLTNGKLSESFGTTAASGGVAGSTYMYIHAT